MGRGSSMVKAWTVHSETHLHARLSSCVRIKGPNVFGLCSDCPRAEHFRLGYAAKHPTYKSKIKMATWNLDGFKTGICSSASIVNPSAPSALCHNNCAIASTFRGIQEDFYRSFKRKACPPTRNLWRKPDFRRQMTKYVI